MSSLRHREKGTESVSDAQAAEFERGANRQQDEVDLSIYRVGGGFCRIGVKLSRFAKNLHLPTLARKTWYDHCMGLGV